jgi:glycosyltransferase involved in cell wall biosynthesis
MNTPKPSPAPTLGVVAISHNEERDLPAFLSHLVGWVDEIVIIDDGSTDRTAEIARAAGPKIKFISAPRQPGEYYSHQRNKGIDTATSDWLLHMDIDERVTPELAQEISNAIRDPAKDGCKFRRFNFFLHRPMRGGGWQKWNLVHLARRQKFRFGGKMHETCLLDAPPERVAQLQGFMWHLGDTDYVERVRKNMLYMQIEAENLLEKGRTIPWFDLIIQPLKRLVKSYFFQGGYRDGIIGILHAMYVLTGTFNWYATAWDRAHAISRDELETQLKNKWLAKGAA